VHRGAGFVVVSVYEDIQPPRLGRGMLKRFAIGALLITLLSAGSVATAVLLEVKTVADIIRDESTPLAPGVEELLADVEPGKPQTILMIGDDRRKSEVLDARGRELKKPPPTRSDTMILVRLDPSKGATALMSLPRDLVVDIPGYGRDRLNVAFALGEDKLTLRTVRDLLDIPIHHYIRVTFWGFRGAVDRLGCVYSDVDRRYFNDNHPPAGGGDPYATIDVGAGYQRMCGQDALDYVRYRHEDNDLVRAARQQSFLGDAKSQIGVSGVFDDRDELLKIFAQSVRTDIKETGSILSLLKLVAESSNKPVQEVQFRAEDADGGTLQIGERRLRRTVERFLNVQASKGPKGRTAASPRKKRAQRRQRRRSSSELPPGLVLNKNAGEDLGVELALKLRRLPVYYPKAIAVGGNYRTDDTRAYDIRDRSGRTHRAYRMVAYEGSIGQYYGVQGTTWKAPPILDDPSETMRMRGRKYELFYDGDRLRLVAWRTQRGVYWVSNTLLRTLTNRQMLALARSLTRVGAE
jgi:polyisoprenyl-teichoic acid--peptidoglycan teichoic acid transferase